jgi:hypothetical protein
MRELSFSADMMVIPGLRIFAAPSATLAHARVKPVVHLRTPEELLERMDSIGEQITEAQAEYERLKGTDPYQTQKQELIDYLAEHQRRVQDATTELTRLTSLPDPRTSFVAIIVALETATSHTASEAKQILMHKVAGDVYDTELGNLSDETVSEIRARNSIRGLDDYRSNWATRFGRTPERERTTEGAHDTARRCLGSLRTIGETVSNAVSK